MVEILWRAQRLRSTIVFVNLPFGFLCIFFFSFGHVLLLPQHFSLFDLMYGVVALFIKRGESLFRERVVLVPHTRSENHANNARTIALTINERTNKIQSPCRAATG